MARRSASSSALDAGEPASNEIAAIGPPIAAMLQRFRFLSIAPPTNSSRRVSSLFNFAWACCNPNGGMRSPLSPENIKATAPIKRGFGTHVVFSSQRGRAATHSLRTRLYSPPPAARRGSIGVFGPPFSDEATVGGYAVSDCCSPGESRDPSSRRSCRREVDPGFRREASNRTGQTRRRRCRQKRPAGLPPRPPPPAGKEREGLRVVRSAPASGLRGRTRRL